MQSHWASDDEGSVFDHEVELTKDAAAQMIRPIMYWPLLSVVTITRNLTLDVLVASMCDISNMTFIDTLFDEVIYIK